MALSGKFNTTKWSHSSGTRYLEFSWESIGQDNEDLHTSILWTLTAKGTYTGYVIAAPFTVVIDGKTVYSSNTRIKLYQDQIIQQGMLEIKHNSDGKKSFTASVKAAIYAASVNCTGSKSFTLDRVGKGVITKAPDFNDEENPTIEYTNPLGDSVESLQAAISFTGEDVDIAYRDIPKTGTSYTFELTEEERDILRAGTKDSNTRQVYFYIRTIRDAFYYHYKPVNFTVINANPIVAIPSIMDINEETIALTGDRNTYIRYHNRVIATVQGIEQKGAEIVERRLEYNGITKVNTMLDITNAESNVFNFTVIDSRGNSASKTVIAPMIDYVKPTINIDETELMDTTGAYELKCSGNYFNDTFGYTEAAAANSLTVMYRYKLKDGEWNEWETIAATVEEGEYKYDASTTITGLNYRSTYIVQCQIIDKLNTVLSAEITVRSLPVFHWGENDFTFEVPVNFNGGVNNLNEIDGGFAIGGDLTLERNIQAANEELNINATNIRLNGNVYIGESTEPLISIDAEAGTWVPELGKAAAVNSYPTQRGWFMKVGNVATIGFQLKAYIKSGYDSTVLEIKTPFNPRYAAFGGGVAHNINIGAGLCFEGWCLQDGVITARLQPCNNTTAGNLNISSTAYYPTTTNQTLITLSGTICYMED